MCPKMVPLLCTLSLFSFCRNDVLTSHLSTATHHNMMLDPAILCTRSPVSRS